MRISRMALSIMDPLLSVFNDGDSGKIDLKQLETVNWKFAKISKKRRRTQRNQ